MTLPPSVSSAECAAPGLVDRFRALAARRETIRYLVHSSLKANHRDKVLGKLWSLLDPLLFMLVYLVVFGISFRQVQHDNGGISEYIIFLLCGVLPWRFFDSSVNGAASCIRSNRGLIHEINFPKAVFPTSLVFARLADFLWGLAAMAILYVILRPGDLSLAVLMLPVLVAMQLVFTLGAAYLIAFLGAFFTDTANLVSVALRFMFYFSPIFYRVSRDEGGIIPAEYVPYYMLNPMACFFEGYRACLLRQQLPDPTQLGYVAVLSLVVFVAGFAVFSRGEGHFAKYV